MLPGALRGIHQQRKTLRVLFVSNLFPNRSEPTRGLFNAQQVASLAKRCQIVKIVAPSSAAIADESFHGIPVEHPRYFYVPVLSRPWNGHLFAHAIKPAITNTQFDIVLVNWAYPDAYGVMLLAETFGFRFATTVQGSDINCSFTTPSAKRRVLRALRSSRVVFSRSRALQNRLAAEGIVATTVYNGIDRELFRPSDRIAACRELNLQAERCRILFVGNLVAIKGPTVLLEAFRMLSDFPKVDLVFIGKGEQADLLCNHPRVTVVSAQPHSAIPNWINACNALCIPSLNEGLPNIALEALSCGLPVVASAVGGVPEVLQNNINGLLVPPNDPSSLANALRRALRMNWNKESLRQSITQFDWDTNAKIVSETLHKTLAS
jgi:glycosyltransferase involved in cell wall biosynthesis